VLLVHRDGAATAGSGQLPAGVGEGLPLEVSAPVGV